MEINLEIWIQNLEGQKIWNGWPANRSRFFTKRQKRGHVKIWNSQLWNLERLFLLKKVKKARKSNYGSHPVTDYFRVPLALSEMTTFRLL
jgi:hypothetical protein